MAGEWLKFESSLPEKPETLAITVAMGWDDPDLTVGKLMRVFRWFDQQTVDGNARGVTAALLDRMIGVTGFVQAMANAGWIVIESDGLALQNFDRHNGETAKSRALTAKRVANHRASKASNAESNAPTVTPALAREEKRREEVIPPNPRKRGDAAQPVPVTDLVQAGFTESVASEFIAHKASKKAPLTPRAWQMHLSEAEKAGWSPQRAAEHVMAKGWKGFEAAYVARDAVAPPINGQRRCI